TAVGLLLADDHAEQRGLARAVRADDADDAAPRQAEGEVIDEQPIAVALAEILRLHDEIAEARGRRDDDLGRAVALTPILVEQLLVRGQPRLGLRLARARRHPHPLELPLERPLQ